MKEWGTGKTRIETMQALGLRPHAIPLASKMDGINAARRTLARCVFHPRCEETGIAALEQYRREWDDEKKTFKASEVHDWTSHPADAFRYLAMAWQQHVPKIVVPKPKALPGQVYLPGPPEPVSSRRIKI